MNWTVPMLSKTRKKTKKKATKKADKAHQPGHRKMKIAGIEEATSQKTRIQESALIALNKSDLVRRNTSKNRRIITGAALGKTGRIAIKD